MNALQKSRIEGEDHAFNAVVRGKFPERDYPTPALLELKVGARVMTLNNKRTCGILVPDVEFCTQFAHKHGQNSVTSG